MLKAGWKTGLCILLCCPCRVGIFLFVCSWTRWVFRGSHSGPLPVIFGQVPYIFDDIQRLVRLLGLEWEGLCFEITKPQNIRIGIFKVHG